MHMIENNLRAMIAQYLRNHPEESHKTIAAKKGVRPETVSRHSHDKIDMSMQDINDYSKILGCTTFDIMYKSQPIPIVGIGSCDSDTSWIEYKESLAETGECLYLHGTHDINLSVCRFEFAPTYQGAYKWLDGAYEVWDATPAIEGKVSEAALMKPALVRTVEEELFCGTLYPQPASHKFSLVQSWGDENKIRSDLELEWAAPVLRYIMRPDLENASVVKSADNESARERIAFMNETMNERRKRKGMKLLL